MGKDTLRYLLLYVGIALGVAVASYIGVSLYLRVPVVPERVVQALPSRVRELLPSSLTNPRAKQEGQGTRPTSIEKLLFADGTVQYIVHGRFVSDPTYRDNFLQAEFIIDEDPYENRIPVLMTTQEGKINVGRFQGNLDGSSTWGLENTETLRELIQPGELVQLRILFFSNDLEVNPEMRNALESMLTGLWSTENLLLTPTMVGVII